MNTLNTPLTLELWSGIRKEITGIQLIWTAAEQMYFRKPAMPGIASLESDTPLLFRLVQTAIMESLLTRVARLMDPAKTGKLENLSLKRLVETEPNLAPDEDTLRQIWDQATLIAVRNKYLSHNDLDRSLNEPHAISIPLSDDDVITLGDLAGALRSFRRDVHRRLQGVAHLDDQVSMQLSREVEVLNRGLLAANCFYDLLPQHPCLQDALATLQPD